MTRGKFYVAGKGDKIIEVTGYKHQLKTSNGDVVNIGLYRPLHCWYVVERTSGLLLCVGGTKEEALTRAQDRADLAYKLLTEDRKDPETYICRAINRMDAYIEESKKETF